jgi:hypothetical protein
MKVLWIVIAAMVAAVIAFIIVGTTMPSEWHVERSIVINATPEAIFPWLNDLRKWPEWTPWNEQKDSTFKRSFAGPERGIGASMLWRAETWGNGRIGITSSVPYEKVSYDLFFDDSMTPSKGALTLVPQATGTMVTWTDDGDMGANIFGRFALDDVDTTVGQDFEAGLSDLKSKVETSQPVAVVRHDEAADDTPPAPAPTPDQPTNSPQNKDDDE